MTFQHAYSSFVYYCARLYQCLLGLLSRLLPICSWLCIYSFAVRSRFSLSAGRRQTFFSPNDSSPVSRPHLRRPPSPVRWAANTMGRSMYMTAPQFPPTMSLPRPLIFPPHALSSMSSPQSPITGSSHGELADSLNRMAISQQMEDSSNTKGTEKRDSVQRSESGTMSSPGVIGQGSNIDQRLA